jgi:hypothetical protein
MRQGLIEIAAVRVIRSAAHEFSPFIFIGCGCLSLCGTVHSPAPAADIAGPMPFKNVSVESSPWRIDITSYTWMPSLYGTSAIKRHTTDIDATYCSMARSWG